MIASACLVLAALATACLLSLLYVAAAAID